MADNYTNKIFSHTFIVASLFTTGDYKAKYMVPCDCMVLGPVLAHLGTRGSSGGSTKIMLRNSTNSDDLLTSAIAITTTDADYVGEGTLVSTQAYLTCSDGNVLAIDIDSVSTGGAEKDLSVTVHFVGR